MSIAMISLLLCEGLLIVFGFYLIWSWITKTPFYPSSVKSLNKLVKSGEIKIPEKGAFVDIGSGDGRIVLWAAKKGMIADGIEFNPFLSLFSRLLLFINGVSKKTKIHNKDFRNHDFSQYNMAYLYIFPEHMDNVKSKLFRELPKGSIVITNTFKFKDREPDEKHGRFYVYKVK